MAGNVAAIKLRQFIDKAPEIPPGPIHHQGKDVLGYHPGQLARLHIAYPPEGQPKLFTKLLPILVKREAVPHHEYDYLVLKQYIHYQRTKEKVHDWYTQTTYREAFTLPFFKSGLDPKNYVTISTCPRSSGFAFVKPAAPKIDSKPPFRSTLAEQAEHLITLDYTVLRIVITQELNHCQFGKVFLPRRGIKLNHHLWEFDTFLHLVFLPSNMEDPFQDCFCQKY